MKIRSWEYFEMSGPRLIVIAAVFGVCAAAGVFYLVRDFVGSAASLFSALIGIATTYYVLSEPKRQLEGSALAQARESPVLAASAMISLEVSKSRSRTILGMDCEELQMRRKLGELKKRTLLGQEVQVEDDDDAFFLPSESASRIIKSVCSFKKDESSIQGMEAEGILSASMLGEETKMPVMVALCFFLPIFMVIGASITHANGTVLAQFVLFQLILLDLGLAFTSSERKRIA
jgi:hypothetical protein